MPKKARYGSPPIGFQNCDVALKAEWFIGVNDRGDSKRSSDGAVKNVAAFRYPSWRKRREVVACDKFNAVKMQPPCR